jgi:hemolysin activation/secretion protein
MTIARPRVCVMLAAAIAVVDAPALAAPPTLAPEAAPTQRSPLAGEAQPSPPGIVAPPAQAPPPEESDDRTPVVLTGVIFEGATAYPKTLLDGMLGGLHAGPTTLGTVLSAVRRLQYRYRTDGYILTKVSGRLVPEDGGYALHIQVIEGFIGSVKLAGAIGPVGNLIYRTLSALLRERPLTEKGLERAVLLCEDTPGITVRTILRPSKDEPGAVTLVAQISRKPWDVTLSLDNRGSRATGPEQLVLDAAANGFTSLGDRTEIVLYNTPFDNEEVFGQASQSIILGSSGLKLRSYFSYGQLVPGDVLKRLDYRSRILLTGISAEYPLVRTRALSSTVSLAFDVTHTNVDAAGFGGTSTLLSKEDLRIFRLDSHSLVQDQLLGAGHLGANDIDIELSQGAPGLFDGTRNGFVPAARLGEQRDFFKITPTLSRSQYLAGWSRDNLNLYLAATGQWSDAVLPPSEKFFLGGNAFGRGFYNGELSGDDALAGTIELQWNAPRDLHQIPLDLQYYAFYDAGMTWDRATADVHNHLDHHIESIGVGVRATIATHYFAQLEGVDRLTRRPDGNEEKGLALFFRVGVRY